MPWKEETRPTGLAKEAESPRWAGALLLQSAGWPPWWGGGGGGSTSPLPHACPSLRFLSVPANVGWPLCWNPWAEAPVSDHYYDPIRSGVPDSKRPPTKRCNYNCKRAWGEGQPKCSWTRIRILQIVSQRGRGMQLRIKEMW